MGRQWSDLTVDEKDKVLNLVNPLRGFSGELAKLSNFGIAISADWNGGVSDIVNSLDATAIIPNTSGLAGAQSLAPADVVNFVGYAINLSDVTNNTGGGGYNTNFHRALEVKMAGIVNTVGQ